MTKYDYDELNRIAHEPWRAGGVASRTITYSYYAYGPLESVSDPASTVTLQYDDQARVKSAAQTITGLSYPAVLTQVGTLSRPARVGWDSVPTGSGRSPKLPSIAALRPSGPNNPSQSCRGSLT